MACLAFALLIDAVKFGIATAVRTLKITTVMRSSANVNPFFMKASSFRRGITLRQFALADKRVRGKKTRLLKEIK